MERGESKVFGEGMILRLEKNDYVFGEAFCWRSLCIGGILCVCVGDTQSVPDPEFESEEVRVARGAFPWRKQFSGHVLHS